MCYDEGRFDGFKCPARRGLESQTFNDRGARSDPKPDIEDEECDLVKAVKVLVRSPYVNLDRIVYEVREAEGAGWEGAEVKRVSDALNVIEAHGRTVP